MRLIPLLASLSGCIAELQTQCTSDDQYIVSLPYTIQNSTLLSATAGICSEKNITYAQDVATFNVTIDINRCKLNTKTYPKPKVQAKNLFMANITNLKVGRTGNGMSFTYLDMDIATECGRQMSYEITHEYGAIASAGSVTPDVGVNETDVILPGAKAPFTFSFQEYTNLFFNETRATGPRQAGTKSFVAITATNMDVTEYSFHVPSCKIITTTGKEQALFRSLSEENSFIDLYKGYRTKNGQQEFLLSHIFFVLDRNSTARYNLTCNVRVCAKDYLGESCDIVQSCSTNPCVHGTCQDTLTWQTGAKKTDYSCTCQDNYESTNCDQAKVRSLTLDTCGIIQGPHGPNTTTCEAYYAKKYPGGTNGQYNGFTWEMDRQYPGVQLIRPQAGRYKIEVFGASSANMTGGKHSPKYGRGRGQYQVGEFNLTTDTVLIIGVGQVGTEYTYCGGAGGGTFVATGGGDGLVSKATHPPQPLIIAGGGGGPGRYSHHGGHAPATTDGGKGSYLGRVYKHGGVNGYAQTSNYGDGSMGQYGAGFYANGSPAPNKGAESLPMSFLNGLRGGIADSCVGGFGGAGGGGYPTTATSANTAAGGAGGYSGGGQGGGGGGSFIRDGTVVDGLLSTYGPGKVIITKL